MAWLQRETHGRILKDSIRECLTDLGDSPDSVAGRLADFGVAGVPGRADDCPVARYLRAVVGSERSVKVVGVLEHRLRVTRHGLRMPLSVRLPGQVAGFVHSFDEGRYPELILTPAGADQPAPG